MLLNLLCQARPASPVPNVTAVITVDAEAMGGGSGYAHRVQLPEGSTMAEVFGTTTNICGFRGNCPRSFECLILSCFLPAR